MKNIKLGRNEPCWCNSGKKHKKCHLNRERDEEMTMNDINRAQKKLSREYCLAPFNHISECSKKIISAHTVPRSGTLKAISRDNHVYKFELDRITSIRLRMPMLKIRSIGINKASTFKGYCSIHDNLLFSIIEDEEFVGSKQQCAMLAYRSLSWEFYAKEQARRSNDLLKTADVGKPKEDQRHIQKFAAVREVGMSLAISEGEERFRRYGEMVVGSDYSSIRAIVFEFRNMPTIVTAGSTEPIYDFDGQMVQDLADLSVKGAPVSLSIFCGISSGFAVLTWTTHEEDTLAPFIESILSIPNHMITTALILFVLESIENVYISPEWWDGLSENIKTQLIANAQSGMHTPASSNHLSIINRDYGDWGLTRTAQLTT